MSPRPSPAAARAVTAADRHECEDWEDSCLEQGRDREDWEDWEDCNR